MKEGTTVLMGKIEQVILEEGLPYGEVMNALSYLTVEYREKADNLLNEISIQKVAETPRFKWHQKA